MSNQYYSASSGAKLMMGQSTANPLPAPGADTFIEVPLLKKIKPPPHKITFKFFSILNDAIKRSVGGKKEDQVCDSMIVCDWTEPLHVAMYNDLQVAGGQKRNWQVIYPDSGQRQLDFKAMLVQFEEAEFDSEQDAAEHQANTQLVIDGAVSVS